MLAGGRSSRFGRDKLKEPYRGTPLLHHAILRLAEVCPEVVVVVAPGDPDPQPPTGAPVRVARDPEEGRGPLVGLSAGLAEVRTELALVAAGDMPELSAAVLAEMLRVAGEAQVDAVALQDGETFRPLPVVVRAGPARETGRALLRRGERSLMALLGAFRLAMIDEPTWHALDPMRATLLDVDRPEDLNRSRGDRPEAGHRGYDFR